MEKPNAQREEKLKKTKKPRPQNQQHYSHQNDEKPPKRDQKMAKSHIWDCGSSLYDSFELNSFQKQLDSAITSAARSMSMPHMTGDYHRNPLPPPEKKPSKFSRSFQKFLRSVFRTKQSNSSNDMEGHGRVFVVYDKSGALSTIPEGPEVDYVAFSPEIGSLVRKTASDRYTAPAASIEIKS